MPAFDRIASIVQSEFDELGGSVELITSRRRVRSHAQATLRFDCDDGYTRELVSRFVNAKAASEAPIFRGLYVHIGTVFEHFVRLCVERVIEVHIAQATRFDDLPKTLRDRHLHLCGRALQTVYEGISGRRVNYQEIARRLGTCVEGSDTFELNKECFTLFLGNCTSRRVADMLGSAGVAGNVWDEAGRDAELKKHFGGSGVRETSKLASQKLDEYIRVRNGIVHRGELYRSVVDSELQDTIVFFRLLCRAISEHLDRTCIR